jgi:hypothetical protein
MYYYILPRITTEDLMSTVQRQSETAPEVIGSRGAKATAFRMNLKAARQLWGEISSLAVPVLRELTSKYDLRIVSGDLLLIDGRWYVTHAGLLRIARRQKCTGIQVQPVHKFCDPANSRWTFKATVYRSKACRGFVGFADADRSNVSATVAGAEMRIAETRAVNRALRKAYGIGICSVEELGSSVAPRQLASEPRKLPQPVNGNGYGGPKVRDRLCQVIRQHQLDPTLVKSYATEFCGVKSLRDASREQVETFVAHLTDSARKDRDALLCRLNSYLPQKEGAA